MAGKRTVAQNVNGIRTDIEWIKASLTKIEEKIDDIENAITELKMFKAEVKAEARTTARNTSLTFMLISTVIALTSLSLTIFKIFR